MKKLLILACALAFATSAFAAPGKNAQGQLLGRHRKIRRRHEDADGEAERQAGRVRDHRLVGSRCRARPRPMCRRSTAGQKVDVEFVMDGAKKIVAEGEGQRPDLEQVTTPHARERSTLRARPFITSLSGSPPLRGCNARAPAVVVDQGEVVLTRRRAQWRQSHEETTHPRLHVGRQHGRLRRSREKHRTVTAHFSGTVEKYDAATTDADAQARQQGNARFRSTISQQVMKGKSKADASSLATSAGQSAKVEYVMDGANRVAEKVDVAAAARHRREEEVDVRRRARRSSRLRARPCRRPWNARA